MNLQSFREIVSKCSDLNDRQIEEVSTALYPMMEAPLESFEGRTLFIRVNMSGLPQERLDALYFFADFIKGMGAKNVLFLPLDAEVSVIDLSEEKPVIVSMAKLPPDRVVNKWKDWLRIAGADPNKVLFIEGDCNGN